MILASAEGGTVQQIAARLGVSRPMSGAHNQQLSLFNAHYDERCFLPIQVYDTATSRPVAILLRTPSGPEIPRPSATPGVG